MNRSTTLLVLSLSVWTLGVKAQKAKLTKVATAEATTFTVPPRLQQELLRLSDMSGGKVGIYATHVESGKTIAQNPKEQFPMASSFKVPIAVQLLARVDSGSLKLDQLIPVTQADLHPGSGMLSERFNWPNTTNPGVSLSVRSLMELMLLISDNSATDLCLRLAGGPSAVNSRMKQLGVNGIRVDRPTAWLIADWLGVPMDAQQDWQPVQFDSLEKKRTPEQIEASSLAFDSDPRDTSTPEAMTQLLVKLYNQPVLKTDTQALLLDIMKRCETGLTRLKGALPPNTEVRHKTGTIGMTTNDVGIITLPGDAGHVAISVFVKSSKKEIPIRERAIAEVTRTIYDYFLFQ